MAKDLVLLVCLLAACANTRHVEEGDADSDSDSDSDDDPLPDPSEALFDPDHILEVDIDMAEADWDALRAETRQFEEMFEGEDCLSEPFGSPFTYFEATVTVDGERLERSAVRKKGLLGSLSDVKPSLKVDFGEYVQGRELAGLDKLTLNNSISDPSYVRQCLTYALFADAGVPAPRCNFARVTVNGRYLGVYVHLESVGKSFLRRHWDDDEGNLYEGTLSDFREGWVGTFERKTNELDLDRSDLDEATRALEASDATLLQELEPVVDVEKFLTFWAMEILTAHWDGYASNTNNFFIYGDPTTGQFDFFPWGADGTMWSESWFGEGLTSVSATGILARRLYLLPETQARYIEKLHDLLDTVWDEEALGDEIDRMEDLLAPHVREEGETPFAEAVDQVRDFIDGRRIEIWSEIEDGAPVWDEDLREPPCFRRVGTVTATFATTWGTMEVADPFAVGSGTLDAEVEGTTIDEQSVSALAGYDPEGSGAAVVLVLATLSDGTVALGAINLLPELVSPGGVVGIDWKQAMGVLYRLDLETEEFTQLGLMLNGSITFDEAGLDDGAVVTGSFESDLLDFPWF